MNASTVSRWFTDDSQPSLENIRKTAEALDAPVVEAMLSAEVLTEDELQVKVVAPDPDLLTDDEVLRQVAKRMGRHPADVVVTRHPGSDLPVWKAARSDQNQGSSGVRTLL